MLTVKEIDALIAKAKAGEPVKEFTPDGDGLYLRIRKSGAASYWLRQHGFAPLKIADAAVGPAAARKAALKARAARLDNKDPAVERKAAREAQKAAKKAAKDAPAVPDDSLGAVFDRYEAAHLRHLKSGKNTAASFRRDVPEAWMAMPVGSITRAMIADLVHRLAEEKPRAAALLLVSFGSFLNWAIGMGIVENNPAFKVPKPKTNGARERVLAANELSLVWRAADALNERDCAHVRLLILTAQRKQEIGQGRWSEIGADGWSIPATRMKNKKPHEFPITAPVREILDALPRSNQHDMVFAGPKGGYSVGGSGAKDMIDAEIARLNGGAAIAPWTLHDLRRSAASGMGDLGIAPHVIECVLSHVGGFRSGVGGTYNRSKYWPEMIDALDKWAAHVLAIVGA